MRQIEQGTLITNRDGNPRNSDVFTIDGATKIPGVYRVEVMIDRDTCRAVVWLKDGPNAYVLADCFGNGPLIVDVPIEVRLIQPRDWMKKQEEEASPVSSMTVEALAVRVSEAVSQKVLTALHGGLEIRRSR